MDKMSLRFLDSPPEGDMGTLHTNSNYCSHRIPKRSHKRAVSIGLINGVERCQIKIITSKQLVLTLALLQLALLIGR